MLLKQGLQAYHNRNQSFSLFALLGLAMLGLPKSVSFSRPLLLTGDTILTRRRQNGRGVFSNQFARMGFNVTDMIQMTACGHTLGQ